VNSERAADRRVAESLIDVSRETWDRLDVVVAAVDRWQATTNLVAPATLPHIWSRHVVDSAQLVGLAPADAAIWVDLGSGAGFPGLVVAALSPERVKVHLVESNLKKAAFLREAARAMGIDVAVHALRIERALAEAAGAADVVSARALAPLPALLGLAEPLLKTGAIGLFPKGRGASVELTQAAECWRFKASLHPSLTDPDARIIRVEEFDGAVRTSRDQKAGPEPTS
jgi:16S rRNA (guanine527-N7)-methyltransferase